MARFDPRAMLFTPVMLLLLIAVACGGTAATAVPATAVPATAVPAAPTAVPVASDTPVPATPTPTTAVIATPEPAAGIKSIPPDPNAKYGGTNKTTSGTPGTWDPNQSPSSSVLSPVGPRLQGLMKMNPYDRGETVLPGLATSWEVSDDGLMITFHLRENVTFHDGSALTADDVVASWVRIAMPKGDEISYRKDWFSRISEIKAVDPLTVQFKFSDTSAEIIRFIASDWNGIYPKSVLEANNNDLKTVIDAPSAGPFKFAELKAGELIRYEKFEDYWDEGFPYLDAFEFHLLGKGGFPAFLVGQIDTRQVNNPTDFQLAIDKGIQGEQAMVPITHALYFNPNVKPFDDVRVRKAIDLVIDRAEWGEVTKNLTKPAVGRWAPPGNAYALPEAELRKLPVFGADMDARIAEAKDLMAEAGFPDGFEDHLTSGSPAHIAVHAEFAQAVLKDTLNIDLEVEVLDWSVWIARAKEQQFSITSGAQFTTLHDPSDFMNTFWRTGGAQNWTGWSNAEFDSIMDKVDTELDIDKRKELVFQAFAVLEEEVPQMNGGWEVDGHMWWPYVKGHPSRGPAMGRYVFYDRQTLWHDK